MKELMNLTSLSADGNVFIPKQMRDALKLKAGAQFVVIQQKDAMLLKVAAPSEEEPFPQLVNRVAKQAKKAGVRKSDVADAVAEVRKLRNKKR